LLAAPLDSVHWLGVREDLLFMQSWPPVGRLDAQGQGDVEEWGTLNSYHSEHF
jgi:hypothetical protein